MTIERRISWDGKPLAVNAASTAPADGAAAGDLFDPADWTVAEVEAHLAEHPDERDAILAAERAGKNRSTLVAALEADAGAEDGGEA